MDLPHKLIRLSSDDRAGMQPFVVCWIFPAFANFGTLAELRNQSPMLEFCIVPNREHIFHQSDIAADERFANDVDLIPERCEYPQLFLFPWTRRMGSSAFRIRLLLFLPDQHRTVDKLIQGAGAVCREVQR
jgi:hypothetical protein